MFINLKWLICEYHVDLLHDICIDIYIHIYVYIYICAHNMMYITMYMKASRVCKDAERPLHD